MSTEADIKLQFSILGIEIDDPDVIEKCLELCTMNRITAEKLVEYWTAFSVSHLDSAGHPTVDRLQKLERDSLSKITSSSKTAIPGSSDSSIIRNQRVSSLNESLIDNLSILEEYSTGDLTVNLNKSAFSNRSMDITVAKNLEEIVDKDIDSELVYKVTFALNKESEDGEQVWPTVAESETRRKLNIRFERKMIENRLEFMTRRDYYVKRKQCERTDRLASAIIKRFSLTDLFTFIEISSEKFITYGRVVREDNLAKETYLEGSADFAPGQVAELDFSQIEMTSAFQPNLFSGQVVVLESVCNDRNILMPLRVYSDASLPLSHWPLLCDNRTTATDTLQFVVVSGPFTVFDGSESPVLQLQCFRKMLRVVQELRPHVLILLGPFFDSDTATQHAANISSLDDLYDTILELMYQQLQSLNIEIFIVPSHKDPHHVNIFPTPSYRPYTSFGSAPSVHFLPNPCIFHVENLAIGISTFDILFEMNKYRIALNNQSTVDKIALFVRHLIEQQSFYPVYPDLTQFSDHADFETTETNNFDLPTNNIDTTLIDRMCHFTDFTPHVLILPSQFVHFAKIVNETLALNPGKCCRKTSADPTAKNIAGSLARFRFEPNCESVNDSVRCQIIRF